jgi:hypothetical protein
MVHFISKSKIVSQQVKLVLSINVKPRRGGSLVANSWY